MVKIDLESCAFFDCKFDWVNFSNADIKTSCFIRCELQNVNFDEALIIKSKTFDTVFDQCDFRNCVLIENYFEGSSFLICSTSQMTASLNEYFTCKFHKYQFTDGTYAYQVLWHCNFQDCVIGWATIGITYGLQVSDLNNFRLVHYFSEMAELSDIDKIAFILERFKQSKSFYRALVMSANFGIRKYWSLLNIVEIICEKASDKELLVRHEEVIFMRLILKYETQTTRVPMLVMQEMITRLNLIKSKEWSDVNALTYYIQSLLDDSYSYMEACLQQFEDGDDGAALNIRVCFIQPPSKTMKECLNQFLDRSRFSADFYDYRIEKGSFIEMFSGTRELLVAIFSILLLLNANLFLIRKCISNIKEIIKNLPINSISENSASARGRKETASALTKIEDLRPIAYKSNDNSLSNLSDEYTSNLQDINVTYKVTNNSGPNS
jgi:hypothetical protein